MAQSSLLNLLNPVPVIVGQVESGQDQIMQDVISERNVNEYNWSEHTDTKEDNQHETGGAQRNVDSPRPLSPDTETDHRSEPEYYEKTKKKKKKKQTKKKQNRPVEPITNDESSDSETEAYFAGKSLRTDQHGDTIYCICRRGDMGQWMIGCDFCDEWYHGDCVNIRKSDEALIDRYACPRCMKNGLGTSSWKKKCRMVGCRKPSRSVTAQVEIDQTAAEATSRDEKIKIPSKYCSDEHGVAYFELRISQAVLTDRQIAAMAKAAKSVEHFQKLGDVAPVIADCHSEQDIRRLSEMNLEREELYTKIKYVEARQAILIAMRDRAMRVNLDIKARKEKEICAFDSRLLYQDDALDAWIEQGGESGLLGNNTGHICTTLAKKCIKHQGWQAIKKEEMQLDEERLKLQMNRLRIEDKDLRDIARRRSKH